MVMNTATVHKDDLVSILNFANKYPDVEWVTITVDSSSGIGSIVKATITGVVDGDMVEVTKTIVDESSW
jgi:hypothetical protein